MLFIIVISSLFFIIIIIIIIIIIFFQFLGECGEYYDQGPASINISCSSETQCRRHNEVGLINEERNQCILPQLADLLLPFL